MKGRPVLEQLTSITAAWRWEVAAFEPTDAFAEFNSKFDYYVAGQADLTEQEKLGLELFNGKGKCADCHPSEPPENYPFALFTDFTYENLGIPVNPRIAELHGVDKLPPDLGLGGRSDIAAKHPDGPQNGKFKVPTLRNIELTAPYGHNGVFATLGQIVHFYNTRDTLGQVPDATEPGFGITGWPAPEVPENVNEEELGNLGLTAEEEAAIVAFMMTLTDDSLDHEPEAPYVARRVIPVARNKCCCAVLPMRALETPGIGRCRARATRQWTDFMCGPITQYRTVIMNIDVCYWHLADLPKRWRHVSF